MRNSFSRPAPFGARWRLPLPTTEFFGSVSWTMRDPSPRWMRHGPRDGCWACLRAAGRLQLRLALAAAPIEVAGQAQGAGEAEKAGRRGGQQGEVLQPHQ